MQRNTSHLPAIVAAMNIAFGNPAGNAWDLLMPPWEPTEALAGVERREAAWARLQKQCENIGGKLNHNLEVGDGYINGEVRELLEAIEKRDITGVRDGLCDILVFTLGAFHIAGFDADADMASVVNALFSRFCATQEVLEATVAKWTALGVTDLIAGGKFPHVYVKANSDQTSTKGEFIPKGKFLKSTSTAQPIFEPLAAAPQPDLFDAPLETSEADAVPPAPARRFIGMPPPVPAAVRTPEPLIVNTVNVVDDMAQARKHADVLGQQWRVFVTAGASALQAEFDKVDDATKQELISGKRVFGITIRAQAAA